MGIKIIKLTFLTAMMFAVCVPVAIGQTNQAHALETKEQRDARMAWWREAKFGLFIHWGVYAVPAGFYRDNAVPGNGEWIMCLGKIPMAEYQTFAKEFNPVKFDADAWVKMAKDAGMKYIVITSKHHDGFAMFPSRASKWNIRDATSFGRDPLQELADACRKHGVKLGFYYSQSQDWNNGGSAAPWRGGKWDKAQDHDFDDYLDKIALPQVRELLTNYGKDIPAVLWWDTPVDMTRERAEKFYKVTQELRPDLIQNNRLGGGFKGDTETPEQRIPPQGYPGKDWETCMTMNDTWGFKRDDNEWKSPETLIRNLCDIASKGGNYLLNVGPTSEGLIPQPSVDRLAEIGRWMRVNSEAIYGSSATPFGEAHGNFSATKKDKDGKPEFVPVWDWRCTTKPGKLYVAIFAWPTSGKLELPGLQGKVKKGTLLANSKQLQVEQTATGLTLKLPAKAPDKIASVVCVELTDAAVKIEAK